MQEIQVKPDWDYIMKVMNWYSKRGILHMNSAKTVAELNDVASKYLGKKSLYSRLNAAIWSKGR